MNSSEVLNFVLVISVYLTGFILSIFISTILHEAGHLICGYLSGYRFVSFRLAKWQWTKDESNQIKFTKGSGIAGTLGQCLMEPCDDEKDFRFILYNLGGSIVNIITGIIFLILFFFTHNEYTEMFLFGIGFAALFLGLTNIIPFKVTDVPNDGTNIKEALKSPEAKHGLYAMLKVNAEMSRGTFLTDYSDDLFVVSENADTDNFLVAYTIMLRSSQLEENGDYEQSYKELFRIDESKLPSFYSGQLVMSMMYHELVHFDDESYVALARERIEAKASDKLFQKLLTMKHPAFMPFHAAKLAFLDNDIDQASDLIVKARNIIHTMENPGQERLVITMLDRLEKRLDNRYSSDVV